MHGTDDPRTKVTHVAPKGSEFVIRKDGPLFYIHMNNGGIRPAFVQQKFTSHRLAMQALEKYFANNPKPDTRTTPEERDRKVAKAAEKE